MKVLLVNAVYGEGSTGKICKQIHELCVRNSIECKTVCSYKTSATVDDECIYASSWLDTHIHNRLYRITWLQGCFSFLHTIACIKKIKAYDPDVIHLNVIHGSYLNQPLLFHYIRRAKKKLVWTFHDCWAFTGYCPYYTLSKCDKWKCGCERCTLFPSEKINIFDTSKYMYIKKNKWYGDGLDMVIVTPSDWLAEQTSASFLKNYPIKVIHNGIDLNVFKPTPSTFKKDHGIPEHRKIILGVAFGWGKRKGLDVFVELSKKLDAEKYQIVLVGTDEEIDRTIPNSIISIHRTSNQTELAMIYSAADVFVNPTREENYPTVNMESIACGTPVITFKTGGSPEIIDSSTGIAVECENIEELENDIITVCDNNPFKKEECLLRAKEFDMWERNKEYIELYMLLQSK